eukprot:UN07594
MLTTQDDVILTFLISKWSAQQLLGEQGKLLKPIQNDFVHARIGSALPQCDDVVMIFKSKHEQIGALCDAILYALPWLSNPNVPTTTATYSNTEIVVPLLPYRKYSPTLPVDSTDPIIERTLKIATLSNWDCLR